MQEKLLQQLTVITEEEQALLEGHQIQKEIYADAREFVVDSQKMLKKGQLIDIRTHTRFAYFPKHRHNYVEIIYMCSGSTTHIINDSSQVVLHAGELLFLNQNASQEILPAREQDVAVNFIVLPEFFDVALSMMGEENVLRDFIVGSLRTDTSKAGYMHFKVADILPVQNLVENMVWSLKNKQANNRKINQTTMGLLFLQLLNHTERIEQNSPSQYEGRLILESLRYIEEQYKNASLGELSAQLNQSIYQLSKLIKKETGHTYKELLQIKRFNKAVELLGGTGLSVADIIAAVGYENSSYFHRQFREKYGMTPKEYRLHGQKSQLSRP